MKLKTLVLIVIVTFSLLGAIHPVNDNSLCKRTGCNHPKMSHDKGGGICLLPTLDAFPCGGFVR